MADFSRHPRTGQERPVLFVNDLPKLHDTHLPDMPRLGLSLSRGPARRWRTVRLRPEIIAIIDGLRARSERTCGGMLSMNEVVAALVVAGLPTVAEAPNGPFAR